MRVLNFSTLFPNPVRPTHGIFVENRLRHLVRSGEVSATVVAPVPYFPLKSEMFGRYGDYAKVPEHEVRHGLSVHHPRYLLFPKVGMNTAPTFMFNSVRPKIERIIEEQGPFDLIDAHYFYPDGVAAAHLAKHFGLPFTITARGTDINLIPDYQKPRQQILWAATQASGIITVCQALMDKIESLVPPGFELPPQRVLRNGVDLSTFKPADRKSVRADLGLTQPTLLSVGHLVERKGHHLIIKALANMPGTDLLIAGEGEEQKNLTELVETLGLGKRVTFLGNRPHEELYKIYSAADLLVLASSREGWPNVLLEAMACGTPVVATDVWGSGEVVQAPEAGTVVADRTSDALGKASLELLQNLPDRSATRAYAEKFSWDATTQGQIDLFREILAQ